jgi:hypothetical protein
VRWENNSSAESYVSTTGAQDHTLTITGAVSAVTGFYVSIPAGCNIIATYTLTPLGAVLAPDENWNGLGGYWPDTSGNFAGITLTASGVTPALKGGGIVLPAGTTTAKTAPLRFTTQTSALTTPEQGTMELVGNSLQFTQLVKRRGVAMTQNVILADTTVANSTAESSPITLASHGAGYLEVGKMEECVLYGTIAQRANPAAILTVRVKYAGSTIQTITTPASTLIVANTAFVLRITGTVRSIGASGTMQFNSFFDINGVTSDPVAAALVTINTTTAQDTTITFQWGEAQAADTITINQGRLLCVEPNR